MRKVKKIIDARTERNIKSQSFQLQHPQTTNADQTDTSRSFSGCVNRSTSITTPQCLGYSSHRANKSKQTLLTQSSAINKKLSPSWEAFSYFLQPVAEVRPVASYPLSLARSHLLCDRLYYDKHACESKWVFFFVNSTITIYDVISKPATIIRGKCQANTRAKIRMWNAPLIPAVRCFKLQRERGHKDFKSHNGSSRAHDVSCSPDLASAAFHQDRIIGQRPFSGPLPSAHCKRSCAELYVFSNFPHYFAPTYSRKQTSLAVLSF